MTNPQNRTSRAMRAIEMLDSTFPGYTIQQAVTEALADLMSLENETPERLHLFGALEDARNIEEALTPLEDLISETATADIAMGDNPGDTAERERLKIEGMASGKVADLETHRFIKAHETPSETAGA